MRFDLTDLRLFLNIAETGSITAGAGRSYLALASASARIQGMEQALGVALLTRERRGVHPTPAGQALVNHARLILDQVERMRGELGEYAKGLKGQVRLLANTSSLSEFLPDALSDFLAGHPNVNVDLEELPSADIVAAIRDGHGDIGIVADSVDMAGLETFPFRLDQLVLVVARDRNLGITGKVAFGELLDQEFIGLAEGSALQSWLDGHAARAGRRLKFRVRLKSFISICRLVERDVGISIIPATAAKRYLPSMAIRIVELADPWALRRLTICVRRFGDLATHAQQLVRHLEAPAGS